MGRVKSRYIPEDDTRLPDRLKAIRPKIEGLWYRGNLQLLLSERIVAIVGSRKMSVYGKQVLGEIVPKFVEDGWVTISGFMYGIDVEVARLTYKHEGKHIMVVGWGIDREDDIEDINLYHKLIEKGGLLLSELEGKMHSTLYTFPRRNRVVVGIANMVIVAEAGLKSGSLNSAGWGKRLGKTVYAVPGSIFSITSLGTNELINNGQAKALTKPVLEQLIKEPKKYSEKERQNPSKGRLTKSERTIVTLLRLEGPLSINEIALDLKTNAGEVLAAMTSLAMKNRVIQERGLWKAGL